MIPKTIHYCWFGGNRLSKLALKCIESWKKFFPDFEIKEWNESNYDIRKIPYIAEAYAAKKFAFVSDYARFDVLYRHGGVYFDTDVEVIKSFDDIDITDPIMFGLVFSNKHIAQPFIEHLLGIKIDHLETPIPEAVLSYEAEHQGECSFDLE